MDCSLRDLRVGLGMTQKKFTQKLGYKARNAVISYENGKEPSPRFVEAVREFFQERGYHVVYKGNGVWSRDEVFILPSVDSQHTIADRVASNE
ncbi:MAG: helix-turn-helix domain-containing protein [Candidatus Aquicultorales bacterium]